MENTLSCCVMTISGCVIRVQIVIASSKQISLNICFGGRFSSLRKGLVSTNRNLQHLLWSHQSYDSDHFFRSNHPNLLTMNILTFLESLAWHMFNSLEHIPIEAAILRSPTSIKFTIYSRALEFATNLSGLTNLTNIGDKQRVLMHRHQGWTVRHGLCHIYMRYLYIYMSCL